MLSIGLIPARYASTRFPGKPLVKLLDKPMIQWTYENAKQSKLLTKVYVVTDDQRIYDTVIGFGGEAIMTGEYSNGSERCWAALQSLSDLERNRYDLVVNIQGDEPLVNPDHIDQLITTLKNVNHRAKMAAVACPINLDSINDLIMNTAITKVVMNQFNEAMYFSRALIPHNKSGKVNNKTIYYKNCGMYAFQREFLGRYANEPIHPLQEEEDLEQLKALEMGEIIQMVIVDHAEGGIDLPEQMIALNNRLSQQQ